METVIVICLLIVIVLLLKDKVVINRILSKKEKTPFVNPSLPEIMGIPKPKERHKMPNIAIKRKKNESVNKSDSFESETKKGFVKPIPQEELDEVFGEVPNLDDEEEEWQGYGEPNGEDGFASGVTFEELNTVGNLLQQDELEPSLQEQAVDIVHRIQGTELFSLLENSIENASLKIARLLDRSIANDAEFSSSTMRNKSLDDFDIGEFV